MDQYACMLASATSLEVTSVGLLHEKTPYNGSIYLDSNIWNIPESGFSGGISWNAP